MVAIRSRLGNPHFSPRHRGVYIVDVSVTMSGKTCGAGQMMVFRLGDSVSLHAGEYDARLMMLRGARRAKVYLVELRRLVAGAHRRGQGGLAARGLGAWTVSPAAGR